MGPERFRQIRKLAEGALELPPEDRLAYLSTSCGSDDELRAEVVSLLDAYREVEGNAFLENPAALPSSATAPGGDLLEGSLPPGHRLGAYQLVDVIGQGGMGVVYRAIRADEEYRQVVAIKVMRLSTDSVRGQRRLREERQILARLEHPGIARLLDGGTTADGLPYLVMEHVDGESITAYCDRRGLRVRERLRLFLDVCAAVQHAHRSLVVHRDLKPANILVTAEGQVKLLDFGIAKLLTPELELAEAPTATIIPLMTPDYASPEQLRGRPITTASDVYSLGVVLYELLTGRRPFTLKTESLEDIVRAVCETEPQPPSEAVRTAGTDTASRASMAELKGDLDTIVLKALRKEPERRYPTVLELSEDVHRHLSGRPVLARADTVGYRVSRFVGRHRAGVSAALLVLASLVGGMVLTVREARIADAHRQRAEQRFDEVRKLADFVMFDMHDSIAKLPGSTPARRQLVAKALEYLDRLAGERGTDPALMAEIASGYERLSEVQGQSRAANLGDRPAAIASQRKAIALRERLAAMSLDPQPRARLAAAYAELALMVEGEEGRTILDRARSTLDSIPAVHGDDTAVLDAWVEYYNTRGGREGLARDLGHFRETRRLQAALEERLLARSPESLRRQRDLAVAYKYYGAGLHALGEYKAAREVYDKAVALDLKGVEADPSNAPRKLDLSFSHASIASLLRDQGDLEGALVAYGKALALRSEVYAADPQNEMAFHALVRGHQSLAGVLAQKADLAGAVGHEQEALNLRERWEKGHPSPQGTAALQASFHRALGDHHVTIATLPGRPPSWPREHWRAARTEYARALTLWQELARKTPLAGAAAENPKQLQGAIAKCDQALASRDARTSGG